DDGDDAGDDDATDGGGGFAPTCARGSVWGAGANGSSSVCAGRSDGVVVGGSVGGGCGGGVARRGGLAAMVRRSVFGCGRNDAGSTVPTMTSRDGSCIDARGVGCGGVTGRPGAGWPCTSRVVATSSAVPTASTGMSSSTGI